MDSRNMTDWTSLARQVASADEIGTWATVALLVLAGVSALRFVFRARSREPWSRRLFWVAYLFLLPFSIFAVIQVIGVSFDAAANGEQLKWLERGGDALLAIVTAVLVVEGLDLIVWNGIVRRKFGQTTPGILIGVSSFIVYFAAAYVIAAVIFDVPVTGALVSSGIVLGVIGLSLQSTIGDIFSGLFISLERPFRIGDWIETEDGRLGQVLEIDWRATRLLSFNNTVYVVPNSKIANSIIENRGQPGLPYGHYFYVQMAPEAPVGLVRRVLLEAVLSSPYVLSDPPPNVYLARANQRPHEYLVYAYFEKYTDSWRGNGDLQARIHNYLKRAGLTVSGEATEILHRPMDESPTEEPPIQQLLGEIHLFQPLSEHELTQLSERVRSVRYRPGDIIMREGETGDSLLVITAGLVLVKRNKPYHRQVALTRLGMGQCIGEMSLLTGRPRSATVEAVTDCEVVEIPKDSMSALFNKRPELVDELARTMTERRAADELVTDSDPEQVKVLSLQDIADRFGKRIRRFFTL